MRRLLIVLLALSPACSADLEADPDELTEPAIEEVGGPVLWRVDSAAALRPADLDAVRLGVALWDIGGCDIDMRETDESGAEEVTVALVGSTPNGHTGLATRQADGTSRIEVYRYLSGNALAGAVAHEVGHHLLWSGLHAEDSESIMSRGAWWIQGDRLPSVSSRDRDLMADIGRRCD